MLDLVLPTEWADTPLYVFFDTKKAEKTQIVSNARVTIIVYTVGLGEENIAFLTKILQAIEIQVDTHINILEYDKNEKIDLSEYLENKNLNRFWWIGVNPKSAGLQTQWQRYKIYTLNDAQHFISDDLATIATKPELKRALWQTIQLFFQEK